VDYKFFLNYKGNLLLDDKWYLHFNRFHFCLMDKHLLIFNAISVSLNWHFFDNLYRNSSLNLNFHAFLLSYESFNYSFNLYCLYLLFFVNYWSVNIDLYWDFNFLNDYLRHWNLNDLKNCLSNCHNFLHNFRYLNYLFDDSRHHNYLLDNFFNFNHSRNFYNLLNNPVNKLLLNLYYLFLNYYWNWLLEINRLDNFLFGRHYLNFFDLYFFNFLSDVRHIDFVYDWNLLGDVEGNYLFDLNILCHKHLLNNWLIHKDFNLSYHFFFVSFNEVRTFNENFLWYLFDNLFFNP
jgi:hypothetical protein